MTPAEKLYNALKMGLIEKYGEEFLELSEDEQNNLIVYELENYKDKVIRQN